MKLAQAQAMVPGLTVIEADVEGDAAALAAVAGWCLRYAPLTAPDPPDGVWIDATGCAHLFGGEAAMLGDLVARCARAGLTARTAIADTPGAAWAVARHVGAEMAVVPPGGAGAALAALPVAALRLDEDTLAVLRRLGFDRIGPLDAAPRGPLARRFGEAVLRRLDQALGRVFEPLAPVSPPGMVGERRTFLEPLLTAEAFGAVICTLTEAVCAELERRGQGARQLDLLFERVDGTVQAVRIGTARAVRSAGHLAALLAERLETVDPGLGVEAMRLLVPSAETLDYNQPTAGLIAAAGEADAALVAPLVDRLINRLGSEHVYRMEPAESDLPERSVRTVPPLAPPRGASWPPSLPRPSRLLNPPRPVRAIALLPDQPPVQFVWRRVRHRVRRADGPERVFGEWWRRPAEIWAVRDYFAVEDERGDRFWLFREGDGLDPRTGGLGWFLHGLF